MIGRPVSFIVLNLITYFIALSLGGFELAFIISIFWSIFIILYNYKEFGLKDSLVLAIIYSLVFDSKTFYISELNLRVWYFYLIVVIVLTLIEKLQSFNFSLKRLSLVEYLFGFIFFCWSLFFLIIENFESKINNVKYWLFYVCLLLVLNDFFFKHINKFWNILDFLISITVFITVWGVFQFTTNIFLIPNFQLDYYNIRPSGFFSETTWYSEFIFFGLILIFLRIFCSINKNKLLYLVPFFILGMILSVTRNTYLAILLFLIFSFGLSLIVEKKIYTRILKSKITLFFLFFILFFLVLYFPRLRDISTSLFEKFSFEDNSALGRVEAIEASIKLIKQGNIYGNGFNWDKSQVTSSGSAIGSKSFSLILMISSIFGFFGGVIFAVFVLYFSLKQLIYYIKYKLIYFKYSFIIFVIFIQMSMFAPLHQYPIGILIIAISVLLFNKGNSNNGKNTIRTSSI
jgi:hypothetical protein